MRCVCRRKAKRAEEPYGIVGILAAARGGVPRSVASRSRTLWDNSTGVSKQCCLAGVSSTWCGGILPVKGQTGRERSRRVRVWHGLDRRTTLVSWYFALRMPLVHRKCGWCRLALLVKILMCSLTEEYWSQKSNVYFKELANLIRPLRLFLCRAGTYTKLFQHDTGCANF